jgi:hypothetical protein
VKRSNELAEDMTLLRAERDKAYAAMGQANERTRAQEARAAALEDAASDVVKFWRDWPEERRTCVRALSGFLADALESLEATVRQRR